MTETVLTARPAARGRSLTDDAIARLLKNLAKTETNAELLLRGLRPDLTRSSPAITRF